MMSKLLWPRSESDSMSASTPERTKLNWSAAPACASTIDSLLGLIGLLVAAGDVDGCGSRVTKCLYNDPSSDLINSNVFFFRKRFWAPESAFDPFAENKLRISKLHLQRQNRSCDILR
jgi:hypothetical protein